MALIKICDYCKGGLGGETPFLQTRGSISEQYEPGDGVVEFRYLTNRQDETHTFCDDACLHGWLNKQRKNKDFISRSNTTDDGLQIAI